MPIDYHMVSEHALMHARFEGDVSTADLLGYVEETRKYDSERKRELLDFRDVSHSRVGFSEIGQILTAVRDEGAGSIQAQRTALLVKRDIDYTLARLYQSLGDGEGHRIRVFRDWDSTVRWLGVEAISQIPGLPLTPMSDGLV